MRELRESLSVGVCSVGRWTRQDCVSNGGQLVFGWFRSGVLVASNLFLMYITVFCFQHYIQMSLLLDC